MKFTLGEIRQMKDPLVMLIGKDLPIKSAWRLNKLIKVFNKELGDIEEFRKVLIEKLDTTGADKDGVVTVPKDKMEQFVEEFGELLQTEIDVEFEPIDIDSVADIQISAKELMFLDKIFV
jgi:hypothetical protein